MIVGRICTKIDGWIWRAIFGRIPEEVLENIPEENYEETTIKNPDTFTQGMKEDIVDQSILVV